MEQLELRSYSRAEIAEIASVNINDSKHFARNVTNKLDNWGYVYAYSKNEVVIKAKPENPAKRIKEILIRQYDFDVQIDPLNVAYFLYAFSDIDGFDCMPWKEREKALFKKYSISVDAKTLSNWCKKLIKENLIAECGEATEWRTEIINGRKLRYPIDEEDKEDRDKYYSRRGELYSENHKSLEKEKLNPKERKNLAWKMTYNQMWQEFGCCYYYCKLFVPTAFDGNGELVELYELIDELAGMDSEKQKAIIQEFYSEWYNI